MIRLLCCGLAVLPRHIRTPQLSLSRPANTCRTQRKPSEGGSLRLSATTDAAVSRPGCHRFDALAEDENTREKEKAVYSCGVHMESV